MVSLIYQGYGSRLDRRDQKMGDGFKIFWFSQNILTLLDIVCMQTGIKKLSMKPDKTKCCSILDNIICYKLDLLLTGLAEPGEVGQTLLLLSNIWTFRRPYYIYGPKKNYKISI